MILDVADLLAFYNTSLGQMVRRVLRQRIRALWPSVAHETVLGLGYATPYLRPFLDEAARVIAIMPAGQGPIPWPRGEANRVALAEDAALPLPDQSMDRVLIVHHVEQSEALRPMLREVWRVLKPTGRLLVVAPNRGGLWARFDHQPFGHGRPFSPGQLAQLLADTMFSPGARAHALYVPPLRTRAVIAAAPAWENIGDRWFRRFSGVVLVEASKQIYAMTGVRRARARLLPVLVGQAARRTDSWSGPLVDAARQDATAPRPAAAPSARLNRARSAPPTPP